MIDPIAFSLGPISVHWYGLIMGSAFFLGTYLARYHVKRLGYDPDHMLNMVVWIIPAAIVCARLYYVAFEWEHYANNPADIIAVWKGGLAIHGGLIGGVTAGVLYVRKHKLPVLKMADAIMPSVILGQAIGRWGNFMNQEAHGGEVSAEFMQNFPAFIRDQMFIDGTYYHPTFLYESLWNLLVLGLLLFMLYRWKKFDGQVAFSYLILYSIGRFFIEGMRTDSLYFLGLRVAQLVSLTLIVAGIILLIWAARRPKEEQEVGNPT
ncbi:prolipoprotein diacylglyceryl transferase [Brevibacillus dissolubilis]|uniref:prolipoprotein diacylglyceryl transferase n=1 Tax=Brevibacillus dissolubilis TaxID=1844116 RepID=UPI0011160953|nr:prolipoprotein diacylglyceryl transferase [Brevibacillus dissolubilis]